MTQSEDEDAYNEFLLKDFEQQYQEYRQAETSRIRYVEFLISVVVAVIAFFATLYQTVGFPAPNIYPTWMLFFTSAVLFVIGYRITDTCVSTRISQMQTAMYINGIVKHFLVLQSKDEKLQALRKMIFFADENWDSEKTPFFRLLKIIVFLTGVIGALLAFSISRVIFWYLESMGSLLVINSPKWLVFWDYMMWSNVISAIVGLMALVVVYKVIRSRIHKDMKQAQNSASSKT